jgi:thioredoxin
MKPSSLVKPKKPYVDLTSRQAVEAMMAPDGPAAVIDFWAPWCAPCKAVAPHFEAVARAYAEEPLRFYKVNTESQPAIAEAFGIQSIPTMIFVHAGAVLDVSVGALDSRRLADKVDWLLSKARGEGFFTRLFGKRKHEAV